MKFEKCGIMFFTKSTITKLKSTNTNVHLKKLRKHLLLSVLKANNDLLIKNLNFSWLPATNLQK